MRTRFATILSGLFIISLMLTAVSADVIPWPDLTSYSRGVGSGNKEYRDSWFRFSSADISQWRNWWAANRYTSFVWEIRDLGDDGTGPNVRLQGDGWYLTYLPYPHYFRAYEQGSEEIEVFTNAILSLAAGSYEVNVRANVIATGISIMEWKSERGNYYPPYPDPFATNCWWIHLRTRSMIGNGNNPWLEVLGVDPAHYCPNLGQSARQELNFREAPLLPQVVSNVMNAPTFVVFVENTSSGVKARVLPRIPEIGLRNYLDSHKAMRFDASRTMKSVVTLSHELGVDDFTGFLREFGITALSFKFTVQHEGKTYFGGGIPGAGNTNLSAEISKFLLETIGASPKVNIYAFETVVTGKDLSRLNSHPLVLIADPLPTLAEQFLTDHFGSITLLIAVVDIFSQKPN